MKTKTCRRKQGGIDFRVIRSYHTFLKLKAKASVEEFSKTLLQNIIFIQTKNTRTKIPETIVHESHVFLSYGNGQAVQNHKNKT